MAPLQDPRIRQTWNNISHNAETATETAAAGIWTFTQNYVNPCLAGISESLDECSNQCFPDRDDRARRLRERGRTRGRAEYSFDFYDDWDDEGEGGRSGGLLGGWGNDELDRLLAGSGSHSHGQVEDQPSGRRRGMSYGTRKGGPRRKNTVDGLPDPTIIPSTNSLGFLQRLPFKIGGTLRYKPSAADLQEHPGSHRPEREEEAAEPLLDSDHGEEGDDGDFDMNRTRPRSSTTGSGDTSDSFRSRGDLFPSDGEDDAVPLSDEFATVLVRRGSGLDDRGSGKTRSSKGKRPSASHNMSRTVSRTTQSSSQSRPSLGRARGSSTSVTQAQVGEARTEGLEGGKSLTDLQVEEEWLERDEDAEVQRKREAATRLAQERGLNILPGPEEASTTEEAKTEGVVAVEDIALPPKAVSEGGGYVDEDEDEDEMEAEGVDEDVEDAEAEQRKHAVLSIAPIDPPDEVPVDAPKEPFHSDFIPARLPRF